MRLPSLDNRRTASYAQGFRREGPSETHQRATELRRQHEQATEQLRARLPFAWQVGKVRPRYQGPSVWEHAPAAIHIQLLEAVMLASGTKQAQARAAGDWLCQPALDTSSGEVRYEPEPVPDHCDGTGGPAAYHRPTPSCKNCLKKAQQLFPNPLPPVWTP
jgi:hypothetical protein